MDKLELLKRKFELEMQLATEPMEQDEKLEILNRVLNWVEEEIDGD